MTFPEKLQSIAADVEARLASVLVANGAPQRLVDAMRHGTLGGGKRFRPFLVIESAGIFGVERAAALDTAVALECLHCYSLIHDDLPAMDDDALRRGRPTVHVAFDEATAILAGDCLLTLAFETLSRPGTHADGGVRAELVMGLARASGWQGMAGGQMLDMEAEGQQRRADEITRIHALKTAALIAYACEAGGILGGASADERAALGTFGHALGLAFQLSDDILDVTGTAEDIGKETGKDGEAGKATLVAALGLGAAKAELARLEADAVRSLDVFGDRARTLVEAARFVTHRKH